MPKLNPPIFRTPLCPRCFGAIHNTVIDLVMIALIQLQSYTTLANPKVGPHAPYTYQSKLVPGGSININKCEGSKSRP